MKSLPSDTKLPWYRVVNSQGKISLPRGSVQYQTQKLELEKEGIIFVNEKFSMPKFQWNAS